MAKLEFLQNLKIARNLFAHRVQTDHPSLDPRKVEGQLERAAIWLTPSSVKGFDDRDFPELPATVRGELKDSVAQFVRVAKKVPPTKPPKPQDVKEAMSALLKVIKILDRYLATDAETKHIQDALQQVKFPSFVRNFEFELRPDWTDDPAIWVWIFVDDAAAGQQDFPAAAAKIEQSVRDALAAAGVARWPYVRFRTVSEQRAL
jgi:hypothetical protein